MDKDNKGLTDTQDGEFILNETGTSVSTDPVEVGGTIAGGSEKKEEKKTEHTISEQKKEEK